MQDEIIRVLFEFAGNQLYPSENPSEAERMAVVATGGMPIGHTGMLRAAKVLAATMVDLYERPEALAAVQAEFRARKGDVKYESYVPPGPPPVPKD